MSPLAAMLQYVMFGSRWDFEWWTFLLAVLAPISVVWVADRRIRARR